MEISNAIFEKYKSTKTSTLFSNAYKSNKKVDIFLTFILTNQNRNMKHFKFNYFRLYGRMIPRVRNQHFPDQILEEGWPHFIIVPLESIRTK